MLMFVDETGDSLVLMPPGYIFYASLAVSPLLVNHHTPDSPPSDMNGMHDDNSYTSYTRAEKPRENQHTWQTPTGHRQICGGQAQPRIISA